MYIYNQIKIKFLMTILVLFSIKVNISILIPVAVDFFHVEWGLALYDGEDLYCMGMHRNECISALVSGFRVVFF